MFPYNFRDGKEFTDRKNKPFSPPKLTLAQVRAGLPPQLFEKNTFWGFAYLSRDLACATLLYKLAWQIPTVTQFLTENVSPAAGTAASWALWSAYCWCQGIVFMGFWTIAHEAGHMNISPYAYVNHLTGLLCHSFLMTPFFGWRASHNAHHKATMNLEREENWVPHTRKEFQLPEKSIAQPHDYREVFEDAPLYTLIRMIVQQSIGWNFYLATNATGHPRYPAGTNHFSPYSQLFRPSQRFGIILADLTLIGAGYLHYLYASQPGVGFLNWFRLWFIPYSFVNNWIVMLTFLHHCDPTIPYYKKSQWTFLRGALSTIDRPFLGWAGEVFLHHVSRHHVGHHLFVNVPFYNQPKVTEYLKKVLPDHYNYDSTNMYRAFWRNFTECCFIEDEGDILFFKNKNGEQQRFFAEDAFDHPTVPSTAEVTPAH
ncbi:Delta-12 fatty acid desaturase protein [Mycena chlorophos]|uniref:Delta-12 fatty acid desaturase protein n=1 Tax=Mycena chlorophos TaxID=658473 RepID=A0A8H6SYC3_MYCCL|nr:Delta-12 fatty acid desaturase protein [Mycena chlorophos]